MLKSMREVNALLNMKNKLFLLAHKEDLCFVFAPTKGAAQILRYGNASGRNISIFSFVIEPNEAQLRASIRQLLKYHKRTGYDLVVDQSDLDTFVSQVLVAISENRGS